MNNKTTFKSGTLYHTQFLPALWLIVLILALPQLSDTFTSSLPNVTDDFKVSEAMIEYASTIYLCGFAVGTLFWGKISDKFSHKLCVLTGFILFVIGCTGCYLATTIKILMCSRFIQAFGSSAGYVLGHAICRGAFHGQALGKVYAAIESALAIIPIIGSFISIIIEDHSWRALFLFLNIFAGALILLVTLHLPEARPINNKRDVSILNISLMLFTDKKVVGYGLVISAALGIAFSYYAEGTFYLVNLLGLSSIEYDFSSIITAVSYMLGGIFSKRLHNSHSSKTIMRHGLILIIASSIAFSCVAVLHVSIFHLPLQLMMVAAIFSQMCIMFGNGMTISNALALALVDYKWCIGTASSLFGFFYYTLISLITLGMGALHSETLLPMPLYLLGISICMLLAYKTMISKSS